MSRRKAKTNSTGIVGMLIIFLFIISSCSPDKKEAESRLDKSHLTTQTKAATTQTETVAPSTLYSNAVEKKVDTPKEIGGGSKGEATSNAPKATSKPSNVASGSSKPRTATSPQTKEQKKTTSSRKQPSSASGSCPCSSSRNCFGPRGGRYCIASGGNKRYR